MPRKRGVRLRPKMPPPSGRVKVDVSRLSVEPLTVDHEGAFLELAATGPRPVLFQLESRDELKGLFQTLLQTRDEHHAPLAVVHPTAGFVGYSSLVDAGQGALAWDMVLDVDATSFQSEASLATRIVEQAFREEGVREIRRTIRSGMHRTLLVLAGMGFTRVEGQEILVRRAP